jgi:hypothetical protein
MERQSTGLMVAGIIMAPIGGIATIGGLIGTVVTAAGADDTSYACLEYDDCGEVEPAAVGVLIGGIVFLATGLVFIGVGGAQVPVEQAPPPQAVYLEPTADGLRLRF